MEIIQLHADSQLDFRIPETMAVHMTDLLQKQDCEMKLDEALAVLLHTLRKSNNPDAMSALGTLLAYMENLEREQTSVQNIEKCVTVTNAVTMSL